MGIKPNTNKILPKEDKFALLIGVDTFSDPGIPFLRGERDVLRAMHLLPGITFGREGDTGFYVRGGNSDQNLILLDEAPIYNAYHSFGFFSVFNTDALKSIRRLSQ